MTLAIVMWRYFISYCQINKIINMSKLSKDIQRIISTHSAQEASEIIEKIRPMPAKKIITNSVLAVAILRQRDGFNMYHPRIRSINPLLQA